MKKMNNKGFSLVELIIVIAIMAILIGVLAPQYIKYVEKSRVSADEDTADELRKAIETACADEEYVDSISGGETVQFTGTGVTSSANLSAPLAEYFKDYSNKSAKSKSYKNKTYTISVVNDSDILKVSAGWN